jgi:GNAT superfamily N-acetyltransferase
MDVERLSALVGAGCALWAGDRGVRLEPGEWFGFSGERAVEYNLALCRRPDRVEATRDTILDLGQPAILMLGGAALGDAQMLVGSSWVCVGSVSLMARPIEDVEQPADARALARDEWDMAREVVCEAFGMPAEMARLALPDAELSRPGRDLWGAFSADGRVAAVVGTILVEDAVCLWSVATLPDAQGQGLGARVVDAALHGAGSTGARLAVVQAAAGADGFYANRGFSTAEFWQQWSRPRWVLGRA